MIRNEKVEWKKLGEIGNFYGGLTGKNKSDFTDGNCKYISYKNVFENISVKLDYNDMVNIKPNEKQRTLQYGDIIFTASSEILEESGYSSVVTSELNDPIYLNSFCFFFRLSNKKLLLPDFSKYLFRSNYIRKEIIKTANGVTRFNISKDLMGKIEIPIPSLETQERIVKILDTMVDHFTQLQAELQAELQARNMQYEHYRDKLLSEEYLNKLVDKNNSDEYKYDIKEITIGELFEVRNGYTPSKRKKEYWENGNIPWFRMEDLRENGNVLNDSILKVNQSAIKRSLFKKNSLILSTSATIGEYALIKVDFIANQRFTIFTLKDKFSNLVNIDYLYYYFYLVGNWCKNNVNIGNFASVDVEILKNNKVLIPPIPVQEHIVSILDNFNKIVTDINEGLPKEIELRQKQYEYYRERLLDFKREED